MDYILRISDPDTVEGSRVNLIQKMQVVQDFLDREGSAPRVRASLSYMKSVGLHLTACDIAGIKFTIDARKRDEDEKSTY